MPKGRLEKKIYYHDTDCGGVVYHAAYLNHLEEGRTELLREKGIDVGDLARRGTIFPVGHASMDFDQEIKKGDILLLKASVVCACVDANLKTKPIPAAELSKLKIV